MAYLGTKPNVATSLQDNIVTSDKIAPNTITLDDLATDARSIGIFRNRIINGDMRIDQRNAGAAISAANLTGYTVDRWLYSASQVTKFTAQQNQGTVTPPARFINYLGFTSTSAYSVLAADYFGVFQVIEGFNTADLGWGTANASTVTLSFWARSSLTGTFGGSIRNGGGTRSYPFTYTISSANTWEQKSITITGDTTGTWATDNTAAISIAFGLGVGSTFSGTSGAWAAGNFISATGATSVVGTNAATFQITGVQLERGTQATSFEYRQYQQELALCQRYFELMSVFASSTSFPFGFSTTKRAAPTVASTAAGFTLAGVTPSVNGFWCNRTTGGQSTITAAAEL